MAVPDYEKKFELLVQRLKLAKDAHDAATDIGKQQSEAELKELKEQLLSLSREHHQTKKITPDNYPVPENEKTRLSALRQLNVLDSPFETMFDDITKLASHVCGTPVALISLVDENRQWFKSEVGLPGVRETPRESAFCAHTIMSPSLMEVADATLDVRFASNPLVLGDPSIRFYAGAPIVMPQGESIGTLCVIDRKANSLNDHQKET